jgi:hypothetical protein
MPSAARPRPAGGRVICGSSSVLALFSLGFNLLFLLQMQSSRGAQSHDLSGQSNAAELIDPCSPARRSPAVENAHRIFSHQAFSPGSIISDSPATDISARAYRYPARSIVSGVFFKLLRGTQMCNARGLWPLDIHNVRHFPAGAGRCVESSAPWWHNGHSNPQKASPPHRHSADAFSAKPAGPF